MIGHIEFDGRTQMYTAYVIHNQQVYTASASTADAAQEAAVKAAAGAGVIVVRKITER